MGAHSFEYVINAKNNTEFRQEFLKLVERDRYEYGHSPYSGDIGQKHDYRMFDMVDPEDLFPLQERHEGDKWGDAHAVAVSDKATGEVSHYVVWGWAAD
tara:strand:- start:54 stop:350 length:297 start_codon:yes stop_codon:yes gene_type:complete